MEWYGGGPAFERIAFIGTEGKMTVELYPPIVYLMQANEIGAPITTGIISIFISNKFKMKKVIEMVKSIFGKESKETRLWYRYMVASSWKLVTNENETVEDLSLSYGDKLMLETKTIS
jgi:hypothetical protein